MLVIIATVYNIPCLFLLYQCFPESAIITFMILLLISNNLSDLTSSLTLARILGSLSNSLFNCISTFVGYLIPWLTL